MSGGYFDWSEWAMINLSEDIDSFVKKQQAYKANQVNPQLPTGDWDHELSLETLEKIKNIAEELREVAEKFKLVDYLLAGDISESTFNKSL